MTEAQPAQAPANSDLPLFYKNPQPLEPVRHDKAGLGPKVDFGFSRITNAIAITASEAMGSSCTSFGLVVPPCNC